MARYKIKALPKAQKGRTGATYDPILDNPAYAPAVSDNTQPHNYYPTPEFSKVTPPNFVTDKVFPITANTNTKKYPKSNLVKKDNSKIKQFVDENIRYLGQVYGDDLYNEDGSYDYEKFEKLSSTENLAKIVEDAKYAEFSKNEQEAYDAAPFYEKAANAVTATMADPMLTIRNAIFEGKGPMMGQWKGLNDEGNENERFYKNATGYDDDWLNSGFNFINPLAYTGEAALADNAFDAGLNLTDALTMGRLGITKPLTSAALKAENKLKRFTSKYNAPEFSDFENMFGMPEIPPLGLQANQKIAKEKARIEGIVNGVPEIDKFNRLEQKDWAIMNPETKKWVEDMDKENPGFKKDYINNLINEPWTGVDGKKSKDYVFDSHGKQTIGDFDFKPFSPGAGAMEQARLLAGDFRGPEFARSTDFPSEMMDSMKKLMLENRLGGKEAKGKPFGVYNTDVIREKMINKFGADKVLKFIFRNLEERSRLGREGHYGQFKPYERGWLKNDIENLPMMRGDISPILKHNMLGQSGDNRKLNDLVEQYNKFIKMGIDPNKPNMLKIQQKIKDHPRINFDHPDSPWMDPLGSDSPNKWEKFSGKDIYLRNPLLMNQKGGAINRFIPKAQEGLSPREKYYATKRNDFLDYPEYAPAVSESTQPYNYYPPKNGENLTEESINIVQQKAAIARELIKKGEAGSGDMVKDNIKSLSELVDIYDMHATAKENQSTVEEWDKPSSWDRGIDRFSDIVSNPFAAAKYSFVGGGLDNMPRNYNQMLYAEIDPSASSFREKFGYGDEGKGRGSNPLDFVNQRGNPLKWASDIDMAIDNENYVEAALGLLAFIPGTKEWRAIRKAHKALPASAKNIKVPKVPKAPKALADDISFYDQTILKQTLDKLKRRVPEIFNKIPELKKAEALINKKVGTHQEILAKKLIDDVIKNTASIDKKYYVTNNSVPKMGNFQDYKLPTGVTNEQLKDFAEIALKNEVPLITLESVFSTLDKLNPKLNEISLSVPKAEIINSIAQGTPVDEIVSVYKRMNQVNPNINKFLGKSNDLADLSKLGVTNKDVADIVQKIKSRLTTDKFITNNMKATGRSREEVTESIEKFTKEFNESSITFKDLGDGMRGVYEGNGKIAINTRNLKNKSKEDVLGVIDHEVNHLFSDSKGPYIVIDGKLHGQPLYDNYPALKLTEDKNVSIPGGSEYQSVPPEQQVRFRKAIGWLEENAGLKMGDEITEEMVEKLGKGLNEGETEFAKSNMFGKWSAPSEEGGTFKYKFLKGDYMGGVKGGGKLQRGKYDDLHGLLNNLDAYSLNSPGSVSIIPTMPVGSKNWIKAVKDVLNKTYGIIPGAIATGAAGAALESDDKGKSYKFSKGGENTNYIELDLSDDEIQAYKDGGYIVEEYPHGGEHGDVLTYKDNADYFDSHANIHENSAYNKQIKERVYSGKWGFNPTTKELVKLASKDQTAPSKEVSDIRANEKNELSYQESLKGAGVKDTRGFSPSKEYDNWWDDPNYMPTEEERKEFVRMGGDKANSAFKDAISMVPGIESLADAAGLIDATIRGDKTDMGIYSAGLALPFIPANLIKKGKNIAKNIKSKVYKPLKYSKVNPNIKAGMDGNFITRPLTPFSKNELASKPGRNMNYRKIGNEQGLRDLINKGGAQAPGPLKMNSGQTIDTPFFGTGQNPTESYKGLFAVEVDPLSPKYNWSSRAGGTNNYGVAPVNPETGSLVKNIPLEDLNVYRKKWFSNNYKKLDKNNLEGALKNAQAQRLAEGAFKWGVRGLAADYMLNDGKGADAVGNFLTHQDGGEIKNLTDKEIQAYKDGGYVVEELPQAQRGFSTPIYVTDPNDPRLQGYKDSLDLYNFSNDFKNRVGSLIGFDSVNSSESLGDLYQANKPMNQPPQLYNSVSAASYPHPDNPNIRVSDNWDENKKPTKDLKNKAIHAEFSHPTIGPTGAYTPHQTWSQWLTGSGPQYSGYNVTYSKPVQPYIYREEEELLPGHTVGRAIGMPGGRVLINILPSKSYKSAYENADKEKYPTLDAFVADAEYYKKNGRNMPARDLAKIMAQQWNDMNEGNSTEYIGNNGAEENQIKSIELLDKDHYTKPVENSGVIYEDDDYTYHAPIGINITNEAEMKKLMERQGADPDYLDIRLGAYRIPKTSVKEAPVGNPVPIKKASTPGTIKPPASTLEWVKHPQLGTWYQIQRPVKPENLESRKIGFNQRGGEFIEMELNNEEIQEYRDGGYVVEEF